ncbi:MAG: restriction endonuclease subunit R, partial [Solirubrobacteraceae bacterium]
MRTQSREPTVEGRRRKPGRHAFAPTPPAEYEPTVEQAELEHQIAEAEAELTKLAERQAAVAERLDVLRISTSAACPAGERGSGSSAAWTPIQKVELFGSLFRGRDDVYATRWQSSTTAKSGYSPKCANEWDRRVCNKPRVRCGACPNQGFASADAAALLDHLQGRAVVGIYPLLADETCWLVAIDLDDDGWRSDVGALRAAAGEFGLDPAIERSRSGEGAHVWFFFAQPVPASQARALATMLLTRAMTHSPTLTMHSYDRLLPSQDTMPAGGFGNLIALPLQFEARRRGNSVFVDQRLEPFEDQWTYLASVPRIGIERLEALVADCSRPQDVLGVTEVETDGEPSRPWRPVRPLAARLADVELPDTIAATLAERLYVESCAIPVPLRDAIRRLAVFANPSFAERQAMRLSTELTPRVIACFEDLGNHVALPRGCVADLGALLA